MTENKAGTMSRMQTQGKSGDATDGFLRIVQRLFRQTDPLREKKRELKRIAKYVKKQRPRLIDPGGGTVEPALAALLNDFYAVFRQAQMLREPEESAETLKLAVVNESLSEKQWEIREGITEESLRERIAKQSISKVVREVRNELRLFVSEFDKQKVALIEQKYHNLRVMLRLAQFDYFVLLRAFDPKIRENDTNYKPDFKRCEGRLIEEPLIRFVEIIYAVDRSAEWTSVLTTIKNYRGFDIVAHDKWMKTLRTIERLQDSRSLSLALKLIEGDPGFEVEAGVGVGVEKIVTSYLSKFKLQAALSLEKIQRELRTRRKKTLIEGVFGEQTVPDLYNYTDSTNAMFLKKGAPVFRHVENLRYTKAFLTDFYKSRIRELIHLLVVKGEWFDTGVSRSLSDTSQLLNGKLDELKRIDASLGEEEELGTKLRNALYLTLRNKTNMPALEKLIAGVDARVKKIIEDTATQLAELSDTLKKIFDDLNGNRNGIMQNWPALDRLFDNNLAADVAEIIKKTDLFVKIVDVKET